MFPRRIRFVVLAALVCFISVGSACSQSGLFRQTAGFSKEEIAAQTKQQALAQDIVQSTATLQASDIALPEELMCFNVNSVQVPSWQSAQLMTATKKLNPRVLRIPGGEVANYWSWQRGGIVEDGTPSLEALPDGLPEYMRYDARLHTGSKLEDYANALTETNTQALFVLNMLTSDLAEQIDMLSAAARTGIEIKYLELGNEYYFGIPNYAHKFPTPEAYGEEAKVWISYLKDIFPDIKVAVFGVVPKEDSSQRENRWNQALMNTVLPSADAVSLHIYPGHGLDPNGFSDQGYPAFDEGDFATIFGEPFRHWQALQRHAAYGLIPADKEVWITEFNLIEDIFGDNSSRRPRVMGTWGHGLYALAMNMMFLEEPRVKMTCNHDLVENFKFGAILPHEDSFEVSDQQAYPVEPMSLSATGQALKMLADGLAGKRDRQLLSFSEQPQMRNREGQPYPALYGWRFSDEIESAATSSHLEANDKTSSKGSLVILNLSERIVQLDISEIVSSSQIAYKQLSADPRTLVTNEAALTEREETSSSSELVTLSPHSVTQIHTAKR